MKTIKIAINGFGRIGRSACKIIMARKNLELVAVNDLTDAKTLAHLLQYDTAYGIYEEEVEADDGHITISGKEIPVLSEKNPKKLPWKEMDVDVVLESTGAFTKDGAAKMHLQAGAKRVIVSAPTKGEGGIQTYLKGVNNDAYDDDEVISNASCTTNCVGPVMSVMLDNFGVEKAMMTTIHGYTASQNIQDGPNKDLRRARAAAMNIIPTTTGAAKATAKVIPELGNKFDGMAMRVPVITGSITDFTIIVSKKTTAEEVNNVFRTEADKPRYKGVLQVIEEPVVSSDIIGNPHSSIVDLGLTRVVDGDLVKVCAWYDNEWGYAHRLVEQIELVVG